MRRRSPLILGAAPAVAAVVLLAAGCGGSSSPQGVASIASTANTATTTGQQGALVAFSRCMRSHGEPNFPDPQRFANGSVKLTIQGFARTPQLKAAMNACGSLLSRSGSGGPQETPAQQRKQLADARSFAECMRSHGVSRFPDPTAQGQLTVEMVEAQGIDVHSPQVLRVVQKCLPAAHGALTPAMVRRAIDEAGH